MAGWVLAVWAHICQLFLKRVRASISQVFGSSEHKKTLSGYVFHFLSAANAVCFNFASVRVIEFKGRKIYLDELC